MALTSLYLDHAATTPLLPVVRDRLAELWVNENSYSWANSSSAHVPGARASALLESARARVASSLGCRPTEIVFLGSATESNNWILRFPFASGAAASSVAISSIEHSSVREPAHLHSKVHVVPVDGLGRLKLEALEDALKAGVRFVSVVLVNNEIGVRQDSRALSDLCRKFGALYHVDAAQALGHGRAMRVDDIGADFITFNGHKIGAPKGIAATFCRSGLEVQPLLMGGGHERGRRSGTVAVELADAFALALEKAQRAISGVSLDDLPMMRLRRRVMEAICEKFPAVRINGPRDESALVEGHILSVTFPRVHSKTLVEDLSRKGLYCSSGSACSETKASSHLENPIMKALGFTGSEAHHVRLSFSSIQAEADHDLIATEVVKRLELCLNVS